MANVGVRVERFVRLRGLTSEVQHLFLKVGER